MSITATDGRVINVEQAAIRTATVTVRALTIDKRQVTLAVFRQLISKPVIDRETGEFRGLPWGTVNYHPDKCADDTPHLHAVWQDGDELRRATEYSPPREFHPEIALKWRTRWLTLALDEGWRPSDRGECWVGFVDNLPAVLCPLDEVLGDHHDAYGIREALSEEATELIAEHLNVTIAKEERYTTAGYAHDRACQYQGKRDKLHARAEELRAEAATQDIDNAREFACTRIQEMMRHQHAVWEARHARWNELRALPQLFIAT